MPSKSFTVAIVISATVTECVCHILTLICLVCCSDNPLILSSLMMYHRIRLNTRNTTGVASREGIAFTPASTEFTQSFCWFELLNLLFSAQCFVDNCLYFFLFLLPIIFYVPFQLKTVKLTFYAFLLEHTTMKSKGNNHIFTWSYYNVSTVEWYVYMQTVLFQ